MINKRLKLGIIFNFSSSWMGGIIYIINLVKTLNFLDDEVKPEIFLFYRTDLGKFLKEFNYPYLHQIEWNFPSLIMGTIKSVLIRKNIFIQGIIDNYDLDAVYPLQDYPVRTKTNVKLISWCADFQHKHYPQYFSRKQILGRNTRVKNALRNSDNLVLSSYDAYNDLIRFFNVRKELNIYIYHFVSVLDDIENTSMIDLKNKYNLPPYYFLVSNQFHKHKNHRILLLALARLKANGIKKYLVMTGKLPDASDSPYMTELHGIINENGLQDQIKFLGVITRNDQLQLMKNSQAVIQPSLFEGWSTVIEDAISLQVPVVASNLKVNIEQLGTNGLYFDANNPDELASILMDYPERNFHDTLYEDYKQRIRNAAKVLLKIIQNT